MFPDAAYYDKFSSRISQLKLLLAVENRNGQIISKNEAKRIMIKNGKTSFRNFTSKLKPAAAPFSLF
jgi:hypothetical protein